MTSLDLVAVVWFLVLWIAFSFATRSKRFGRSSLTQIMNARRREWFRIAAGRELRMIDTAILGGLQNGTAFFASTSVFAIGGCFALLGATDEVLLVVRDLPVALPTDKTGFEIKVIGLMSIFAYSFFKFGWSYRLFNYSSILFGALPSADAKDIDIATLEAGADRAARMNILAGQSFNAGLRAIFMSIGFLGWFASAWIFMASALLVLVVLVRRQYFSPARLAAAVDLPPTPSPQP
ncbi:DUF599 domain-containing protein [Pseudohoeflea coraliihabitans]|uniref:DUF599 family protein n=1 Tax=Pseudohoeflea coraliihabitans TaxID=2860393 RepID=A0ABS6WRD4_9HYPH|nr:DUF599 family protein [Pseudohoeflea sp. DP4N28-3]MBW3098518.1 DUF599 family protein [Pseudohoeflea sp. DP4N28-3]